MRNNALAHRSSKPDRLYRRRPFIPGQKVAEIHPAVRAAHLDERIVGRGRQVDLRLVKKLIHTRMDELGLA